MRNDPSHRIVPEGCVMVLSWIWVSLIGISLLFSFFTGSGQAVAAAVPQGAQSGISLAISISGSLCLWSGIGNLMEKAGITQRLSQFLRPLLDRLFPESQNDPQLAGFLSANVCANLLGLGNAATPMGIRAAKRLSSGSTASDSLCRLVVLNTASIQLIPATVAALRTGYGCQTPYDILPAVWVTSLCSAGAGLLSAWGLSKVWSHA